MMANGRKLVSCLIAMPLSRLLGLTPMPDAQQSWAQACFAKD